MLAYFLMWILPAWSALTAWRRWSGLTTFLVWLFFSIVIGLRYDVGADWLNYLPQFEKQIGAPLDYPLSLSEPGYALVNWICARLNWYIFGVNLICGGLFSFGLVRYCRQLPNPSLALVLAFPYLTVVVAMGYSRQGVAIGLALLALLALERDRLFQFLAWLALASTFHGSALTMLLLPLATIRQDLGRLTGLIRMLLLCGAAYGLFNSFLSSYVETYHDRYLEAQMQSQGALVRVTLCLIPALVFLWKRRYFPITPHQRDIYTLMAWLAVAAAIGLVVSTSSTAVDRVTLYLIPLQIFICSYLPLIRLRFISETLIRQLLVLFSLAVLSIWLFFASNAYAWIPYRNLLLLF